MVLIGGTSHVGKSTTARRLAERLGWAYASTDKLARHPGRPWASTLFTPPPHVAEHYLSLGPDELMASVLAHYRDTVWPLALELVRRHADDSAAERLVLEGSALWPPLVAGLGRPGVSAVWMTASDDLIERRILAESGHSGADGRGRRAIDAFLGRSLDFNRAMMQQVQALRLAFISVGDGDGVEAMVDACLGALRPLG